LEKEKEKLRKQVESFDASKPIEQASTPPASWYTSPSFFKLEKESVFRFSWFPVARLEQLQKAGDYVAGELFDAPFVVVRTKQQQQQQQHGIKAFYNTCRHKAAKIVGTSASRWAPEEVGCVSTLICPYHGWSYSLDGDLLKAPHTKECLHLEPGESNGLVEIKRLQVFGPWVFISFAQEDECEKGEKMLAESWAELERRLAAANVEKLVYHSSRSYEMKCNWKVYVDNYLDGGYHVPVLHKALTSSLAMESYTTEIFSDYSIQSCGGKSENVRIGDGALYAWLWPCFMVNRYGPTMDTNFVIPLSHDRTLVTFDFFFEPDAELAAKVGGGDGEAKAFIESSLATAELVQREDMLISESVQTGLLSPAYNVGRYSKTKEEGELHFHRLLHSQYTKALSSSNSSSRSRSRIDDKLESIFSW